MDVPRDIGNIIIGFLPVGLRTVTKWKEDKYEYMATCRLCYMHEVPKVIFTLMPHKRIIKLLDLDTIKALRSTCKGFNIPVQNVMKLCNADFMRSGYSNIIANNMRFGAREEIQYLKSEDTILRFAHESKLLLESQRKATENNKFSDDGVWRRQIAYPRYTPFDYLDYSSSYSAYLYRSYVPYEPIANYNWTIGSKIIKNIEVKIKDFSALRIRYGDNEYSADSMINRVINRIENTHDIRGYTTTRETTLSSIVRAKNKEIRRSRKSKSDYEKRSKVYKIKNNNFIAAKNGSKRHR